MFWFYALANKILFSLIYIFLLLFFLAPATPVEVAMVMNSVRPSRFVSEG
jgi:hypothetical protein